MKVSKIVGFVILNQLSTVLFSQNLSNNSMKEDSKKLENQMFRVLTLRSKLLTRTAEDSIEYVRNELISQDSILLNHVVQFLDEFGWVEKNKIGEGANKALFLAIQHSNLEIMKKYHPLVKAAMENGNVIKSDFALLEDRILVREKNIQKYGTQYKYDSVTNVFQFYPIEDIENVNRRRRKMGLGRIQKYAKNHNIDF